MPCRRSSASVACQEWFRFEVVERVNGWPPARDALARGEGAAPPSETEKTLENIALRHQLTGLKLVRKACAPLMKAPGEIAGAERSWPPSRGAKDQCSRHPLSARILVVPAGRFRVHWLQRGTDEKGRLRTVEGETEVFDLVRRRRSAPDTRGLHTYIH